MEEKTKYTTALHLLIVALLAASAYYNGLNASFHFDDRYVILEDEAIKDLANTGSILKELLNRPLLRLTFALNYRFGGLDVTGYHLVNLALHIAVSILVYLLALVLLRALPGTRRTSPAFPLVAALVFALHPLQTGSVTYIAGRSAVMAAFFFLCSLLLFIKSCPSREKAPADALNLAALAVFVLGLGVKATVVSLPLVIVLYTLLVHEGGPKTYVKKYGRLLLPWLMLIPAYLLLRYSTLSSVVPLDKRIDEGILPAYHYFLTELNVVVFHYLGWLFLPFGGPHVDPDIAAETTLLDPSTLLAVLIIAALVFAAFTFRKSRPIVSFAVLWYFLTLLPTSSVFPLGDVAVERHVYLPSVGFALIAGYLLSRLGASTARPTSAVAAVALVLSLIYLTAERNTVWKSELTLWEDAAMKSPNKVRVLNNRAWGHFLAGDIEGAEGHYMELLGRFPDYSYGYNNLGQVLLEKGDVTAAINSYVKAVELRPDMPEFHLNLGAAYDTAGFYGMAEGEFREALAIDGSNRNDRHARRILTSLASTLAKKGDYEGSIAAARKGLALKPETPMFHYTIGYSYEMTGRFSLAVEAYERAIGLDPGWELPKRRIAGIKDGV
ncbi:MAG: tetratricopeptide repeat protein [Thermodesulfobacteriota bacterium]